ncbi:MAG: sulfatase-like hydrolase/transferase [Dysgonamonadaceae bacterium]|jgi:phosphoglycerol transferase MdoB-like AlkP superfamily enzyme|nr:sulfatase-like hydrolase/transferase [Dysgonamonadaceae bacterium]
MKRTLYILVFFALFLLFSVLMRPVFLLWHWPMSAEAGFSGCLGAIKHGFVMDMAAAGYLTALPALLMLVSTFFKGRIFAVVLKIYAFIAALISAMIFIPDLELYSFWGFRIDATVFNYIDHPAEAAASVSGWTVAALLAAIALWTYIQYFTIDRLIIRKVSALPVSGKKIIEPCFILILIACVAIVCRGGITVSTMNVGRVYFSDKMYLNHAAVNPLFNMLASIGHSTQDFGKMYRFMPDEEATAAFESLKNAPAAADSAVLKTARPNLVFVIMESCGASVLEAHGGAKGVMPCLSRLSEEGLFFRNMTANSFRTDRGLAAILAGFPAQPNMSIIKFPNKTRNLQSLPSILHDKGYHTSYLHGGDVDFANIKSFLVSQKITDITRDTDFPVRDLLNKWGAPDHITFPRLLEQIKEEKREPYLKIFLTLSSHEPFEVPYHKFGEPYLNSVAYTDSCLGRFVSELRLLPEWDNLLLVVLPDHAALFPSTMAYNSPERHRAYMLWLGGALKQTGNIDKICMQSDFAATLLAQLGIDTSPLPFSRDILNGGFKEFGFYDFPDGFGAITRTDTVVYDCNSQTLVSRSGAQTDSLLATGKAFLQKLFDCIAGL